MIGASSWLWMAFFLILIVSPVGYGWGYRGWGPPYPRYVQRRRASQASATIPTITFDHHAWGWGGDVLWIALIVWTVWICSAVWWR